MKRILILTFFLLFAFGASFATHNRAGEITYEQISQYYYKVTITTYTKTSSPADRPELEIFWGDGTSDTIPRASFQDNFGGAGSDIRRNIYYGYHTYPGPSVYKLYFEDPNRNGGVINIPNSINVPFYVETMLIIFPTLGFNNSPVLLQPPIDEGVVGQVFIHNANAYDPDGDSLSYELIFCKGAGGLNIPGYTYPTASTSFTLDAITGDLVWDSPVTCGEFNVAFLIKEWRNGFNIGYVERDMQINILCNNPNNNAPPQITSLDDTCVVAGSFISFQVTAIDTFNTTVTLTATGGPLQVPVSPAVFNQPVSGTGSVTQTFEWQTECDHVQRAPYQMVFKAKDSDPFVQLVMLKTVRITVIAPPVQNPQATPSGNNIILTWDVSPCPQAIGYKIYRRIGFYGFVPGYCETGVPGYTGYSLVGTVTGLNTLTFTDSNNGSGLAPGTDYCYMIVAYYSDGAESIASVEVCTTLKKDLPVITNVSVTGTDAVTGTMYIAWSKPTDLDTVQWPGPYQYRLFRGDGFTPSTFTQAGITPGINDTTFNDVGLNTAGTPYTYRVDLYASPNGQLTLVGPSQTATSVYLNISPSDEQLTLTWQYDVPWKNDTTAIYRFDGSSFVEIGTSVTNSFTDTLLNNGQEYCYKVRTRGSYSGSGFADPLYNLSQEACERPYDNVPPCAIDTDTSSFSCEEGNVTFTWNVPDPECADDVQEYHIYYTPTPGGTFSLLAVIPDGSATSFTYDNDTSIAGCYYVAAVDTNGNVGGPGQQICVDNCPSYILPTVFTPDGNGANDQFMPFIPYRNVKDVEVKIFTRWGQLVFETTDPDIRWNGKTDNTGEELPSGVYFYTCKVNEIYLNGIRQRELKPGTIQLIRNP